MQLPRLPFRHVQLSSTGAAFPLLLRHGDLTKCQWNPDFCYVFYYSPAGAYTRLFLSGARATTSATLPAWSRLDSDKTSSLHRSSRVVKELRRFWVSPKWSHSFPARRRSPLGLAPFVIDTPSVDVMGHARQASSTYARFDRLDIASGGRQRPSHFHPMVNTHPHTHTPIFSTQSSLVVTTCVRRRDCQLR